MTVTDSLPPFPVDDVTLDAIEHALSGAYEVDADGKHRLVGADYTLSTLLDFLGGTLGEDPDGEVPEWVPLWEKIAAARVVMDSRTHYSEHDLVRALIAEVRRLRGEYA